MTEDGNYNDWVNANAEDLIIMYGESLSDFPEDIYEGVLDDDYEKAECVYVENIILDDVPNAWLTQQYINEGEDNGKY